MILNHKKYGFESYTFKQLKEDFEVAEGTAAGWVKRAMEEGVYEKKKMGRHAFVDQNAIYDNQTGQTVGEKLSQVIKDRRKANNIMKPEEQKEFLDDFMKTEIEKKEFRSESDIKTISGHGLNSGYVKNFVLSLKDVKERISNKRTKARDKSDNDPFTVYSWGSTLKFVCNKVPVEYRMNMDQSTNEFKIVDDKIVFVHIEKGEKTRLETDALDEKDTTLGIYIKNVILASAAGDRARVVSIIRPLFKIRKWKRGSVVLMK